MHYQKTTILILFLFFCFRLNAQENLGLKVNTYSGVNSALLNPANPLTSLFAWDVNIAGMGVHLNNNYAYIQHTSLFDYLKHANKTRFPWKVSIEELAADERRLDFYSDNRKKYSFAQVDIMGPSFMIKLNNQFSLGLLTRVRAIGSGQKIPGQYGYYAYDNIPQNELFNLPPAMLAGMAWSEIGLNGAIQLNTYNGPINVGVALKFLQGYEAYYVKGDDQLQLTQLAGDSLQFTAPTIKAGVTTTNINGNNNGLIPNGKGFGIDAGFSFLIGGYQDKYDLKLGVALLDIGKINFTQNAERHLVDSDSTYIINYTDYLDDFSVDDFLKDYSFDALGDSTGTLVGQGFDVWLPGALSIQADYPITDVIAINATLIQRLMLKRAVAVRRSNLLAVTPRYEQRWFGASLPVSLYNWKHLQVGAALRLGFLTIGSDNLGGFLKTARFRGADFYFALKFNPFDLNTSFGGGGRGGKSAKCYTF